MNTLLASVPLVVILVLMLGFRWGGAKAGIAGWISSLVIAALWFDGTGSALFWAQVQGFFRALYVLYIIWGALLFFRVTEADGTLKGMSEILRQLAPGQTLQVLLLAWGFTSFLQSLGGFGVPVAVVAPILVTMGFPALDAVVICSLGLSWAVSFGSLGTSYEALVSATAIEGATVAPWMAAALAPVCLLAGLAVLRIATQKRIPGREIGPLVTMGVAMGGVQYLSVIGGVENIAALLGSLAGLIVGSLWALVRRSQLSKEQIVPISPKKVVLRLLPYIILLSIIFAINFIPLLDEVLGHWRLQVEVPSVALRDGRTLPAGQTKAISILSHPGAQLVYAALITVVLAKLQDRLPSGSGAKIRAGVVRSGTKSSLGILAMMAMATTMQTVGMVSALSTAMASLAGQAFPVISPFIGALGAFMTGSNTNSNVLLGAFQLQVGEALGLLIPLILALHNAGAAVGSVFSPAKIIVGCSTVGLSGGEGEALRRTSRVGLVIITIVAVFGLAAAQFV